MIGYIYIYIYINPKPLNPPPHSPFLGVLLSARWGKYIAEKRTPTTIVHFLCKNISFVSKRVSKTGVSGNQPLVSLFG